MNTEKLANRDYYLVLDKSGSMSTDDCPGGKTRWDYAQESVLAIARKLNEFDPDGIAIVPFASTAKLYDNVTPAKVADLFKENEPGGGTNLATALDVVFRDYNAKKKAGTTKANGAIAIVITDGQPLDGPAAAKGIVAFGNSLSNADEEFGISFFQIGHDQAATAYLKSLDDDLGKQGAKHDIVDTKTIDEVEAIGMTEAILAALSD